MLLQFVTAQASFNENLFTFRPI